MPNYILAESFGHNTLECKLYYVMDTTDLDTLASEQDLHFGDKALVLKTGAVNIFGNDGQWYAI